MQRWQSLALGFGFAAAAVAARADAPAFDVKPGLWQMTMSGKASGALPIPPEALKQMTPEQRASIEAAMARAASPHVIKSCVTAEQLARTPDFTHGGKAGCKQTVVTRTATEVEIHESCGGPAGTMFGTFHFTALNRETIAGTTSVTQSNGDKTMSVRQQIGGKWLGSDCGAIKPGSAR
jgi:hypothetical protein